MIDFNETAKGYWFREGWILLHVPNFWLHYFVFPDNFPYYWDSARERLRWRINQEPAVWSTKHVLKFLIHSEKPKPLEQQEICSRYNDKNVIISLFILGFKKKHKLSLRNGSIPRVLPLPFSLCILLKYLRIMVQ